MKEILNLLQQRRIIASIISFVLFILGAFGIITNLDPVSLTEMIYNIVLAITPLITSILALWSYIRPKK